MDRSSILKTLSKSKEELRQRFSISKIGLFGSFSKGNQKSDSDIDILYELTEGSVLGLKEIFDLENYFKDLLSIEKVDLVDKKFINPIIELEIEDSLIYI